MKLPWKKNGEETKHNLTRWRHGEGLAIGLWGGSLGTRPREDLSPPNPHRVH